MDVAIIADDLTGAADSGVQLMRSGYRTAVVFRGAPIPPSDDLDAVAVDTNSRPLPAGFAAKRVVESGHALRESRIVYKKIDSTLRGPIGAELAAALAATGRKRALVAPAFPQATSCDHLPSHRSSASFAGHRRRNSGRLNPTSR